MRFFVEIASVAGKIGRQGGDMLVHEHENEHEHEHDGMMQARI
jgi:hypothetical protein